MKFFRFQTLKRCLCFLICLSILAGCGTVRLEVPAGHDVRLLEHDDYASVRVKRTAWFWLWGARPISDNSIQKDIEKLRLKEVRLLTEQNMVDNLSLLFTAWFSIVRRTMIIEGNTEPYRADVPIKTTKGIPNE